MLLEGDDAGSARSLRDSGVEARRGDDITIHFAVPGRPGTELPGPGRGGPGPGERPRHLLLRRHSPAPSGH
ncbi:MAG: hypothetical protein U5R48_19890 [Gammaproteobacteria bacterium]|nr:hypothetical protein [Gammaproteobacteria bacterium]